MRTQDLYLEYARVIEMCEGTVVKPLECVRFSEFETFNNHPKFDCYPPSDYKFAITILEGKPVFIGDEVFVKDNKYPAVNWSLFDYWKDKISELSKDWTWKKPQPKRTFMLNGVELPCPEKSETHCIMEHNGMMFYFKSMSDIDKWQKSYADNLTAARDKT